MDDRAGGKITNPKGTERLHEYWVHGEGAAKIRWGTPGDFDRCVRHLAEYIRDPKGYCNLAHHAATGMWPAQHAEMVHAGRDAGMTAEYRAPKKFGVHVSDSDGGRSAGWMDTERRYTPGLVEVRSTADGPRIGGYGAVFGKLSRNLGGFVERVGDGAFNQSRSVGWPNVVCRYNHDPNMVLGTTHGGTLQLRTDNIGLDYDVVPPSARADIVELVQRRDIQFSSFAFRVPPGGDEWGVTDQNYPMRTLHEVQLVDVAPVLDPAYPDATAGLRSLAAAMEAPFEDVAELAAEDELRRFFVRTDQAAPVKPKPTLFAASAAASLMARRTDPWE